MTTPNTVNVRYVGPKEEETDHLYGTKLTWTKDQVHPVPADKWELMKKHTDVWQLDGDQDPADLSLADIKSLVPDIIKAGLDLNAMSDEEVVALGIEKGLNPRMKATNMRLRLAEMVLPESEPQPVDEEPAPPTLSTAPPSDPPSTHDLAEKASGVVNGG